MNPILSMVQSLSFLSLVFLSIISFTRSLISLPSLSFFLSLVALPHLSPRCFLLTLVILSPSLPPSIAFSPLSLFSLSFVYLSLSIYIYIFFLSFPSFLPHSDSLSSLFLSLLSHLFLSIILTYAQVEYMNENWDDKSIVIPNF